MSKLPFGGFELESDSEPDSGWKRLETVAEYLEDAEVVPPLLAHWLGRAIQRSGGDAAEFLRLLELKSRRGRPRSIFTEQDEFKYGAKVVELEEDGLSPEAAISAVLDGLYGEGPSRSQLQKWRNKYRRDMEEVYAIK
ncbi:MAG: hypothetical protein RL764_840 [Pseudomonadota bacterium]|jgi:hypothetical protein